MGATVTRTRILRPDPIDAYLIQLTAFDDANSIAQYPGTLNLSQDPFWRLYIWGNLRYKKLTSLDNQQFQIRMIGGNVDVELWSRFYPVGEVTPADRQGEEWVSDATRVSRPNPVPRQIFPPGMAIAVTVESLSADSDCIIDLLMFESLDPNELRSIIT